MIILYSEIEIFLWEKSKFLNTNIEYPINLHSPIVRYPISIWVRLLFFRIGMIDIMLLTELK